jgi:hypothetical protein
MRARRLRDRAAPRAILTASRAAQTEMAAKNADTAPSAIAAFIA